MSKLALVTGGSGAIGGATAALLRERGWTVEAPTRREMDMDSGLGWSTYSPPTRRSSDELGALIFCHGEWFSESAAHQGASVWSEQYQSRVIQPFLVVYWNIESLVRGAGCVVMVSSTRGFIGGVNTGPYAAACAAQIALMQGYAREWPGVRFNCVAPGHTAGRMGDKVAASGGAKAGSVPQDPAAVAAAIVGLVEGNETGQVLRVVDGQTTRARWVWE